MLGKLSIAAAVTAILMIPTALSAQVGGAVNPGAAVRGAVVQGSRPQRISGLRVRRNDHRSLYRLSTVPLKAAPPTVSRQWQ